MHYVYVLRSRKDGELYTGCSNNLERRVREHNAGKVTSTKLRKPLELVHYEAFINQADAFAREQWYKTGWGRQHQHKMLSNTLKTFGGLQMTADELSDKY